MDKCTKFAGGTTNHRLLTSKSADLVAAFLDKEEIHRLLLLLLLHGRFLRSLASIRPL